MSRDERAQFVRERNVRIVTVIQVVHAHITEIVHIGAKLLRRNTHAEL